MASTPPRAGVKRTSSTPSPAALAVTHVKVADAAERKIEAAETAALVTCDLDLERNEEGFLLKHMEAKPTLSSNSHSLAQHDTLETALPRNHAGATTQSDDLGKHTFPTLCQSCAILLKQALSLDGARLPGNVGSCFGSRDFVVVGTV